jgi:ferredoxin--NADP+ reductase
VKNPFYFDVIHNHFKPRAPGKATVTATTVLTPDDAGSRNRSTEEGMTEVRHIEMKAEDPEYKYRSGQSAGIIPPGEDPKKVEKGAKKTAHAVRLYSIASPTGGDEGDDTFSLTVTRDNVWDEKGDVEHTGVCSNFLCDLDVGAEVVLSGPAGRAFLLEEELDHNLIFVATGTGIAPFRGMLMELDKMGFDREVRLFFGVPYSDEVLYDELFKDIAARHSNIKYITAVSREQKNATGGKMYVGNRVAEYEDDLRELMKDKCRTYICGGPKGMENGVVPILRAASPDPMEDEKTWRTAAVKDESLLIETY